MLFKIQIKKIPDLSLLQGNFVYLDGNYRTDLQFNCILGIIELFK